MKREEIIEQWNKMAPRERDAWVGKLIGAQPSIEWRAMDKEEKGYYMEFETYNEAQEWSERIHKNWPKYPYAANGGHIKEIEIWMKYSEDISAAWVVVEKMQCTPCKDGDHFVARVEGVSHKHIACFFNHLAGSPIDGGDLEYFESEAETAPKAICLAAIIAKEANE